MPASRDVPKVLAQQERPQVPDWTGFDDRPSGRGQKMANMSTVAIIVTLILHKKEAPNEIHSHQEPLLLDIWGTITVLTLETSVKWSVKESKTLLLIR